jgi:hypothetical protein
VPGGRMKPIGRAAKMIDRLGKVLEAQR